MRLFAWAFLALAFACSDPTGPTEFKRELAPSAALSGRVVGQFDGLPKVGVTVRYGSFPLVNTDTNGSFTIPGTASTRKKLLTLTSNSIIQRKSYVASTNQDFRVLPMDFNMTAFNDIGREFSIGTIRWTQAPTVYISTIPRGTGIAAYVDQWAQEVASQAPGFVTDWTNGPSTVVVTANPPTDFTPGSIVVHFSESNADYNGNGTYIGIARRAMSGNVVTAGTVHMRYKQYRSNLDKRKTIFGHEIGHIFGYAHMNGGTPSLMQPNFSGTSTLRPFDFLAADFMYDRLPKSLTPDTESKR